MGIKFKINYPISHYEQVAGDLTGAADHTQQYGNRFTYVDSKQCCHSMQVVIFSGQR